MLVAGLAGVANGLLWQRTVAAATAPVRRWARVPVGPIAIALALAGAIWAQAFIGFAAGGGRGSGGHRCSASGCRTGCPTR